MRTLYVGGLPEHTSSTNLRELFERFGGLHEARIVSHKQSGACRGFGYVTFFSELAAHRAKSALDGTVLDGQRLRVDLAD